MKHSTKNLTILRHGHKIQSEKYSLGTAGEKVEEQRSLTQQQLHLFLMSRFPLQEA